MKQASWGFVAGMMVMAGLWGLTPRTPETPGRYGAGVAIDLRDC
jgi:hypothetical protein